SYFAVYSISAASPRARTSAIIAATCAWMAAEAFCAGRRSASRRSCGDSASQAWIVSCSTFASGQHLLDRQDEHRARARFLQTFQRFPEHVLATDGMHGDFVSAAIEWD